MTMIENEGPVDQEELARLKKELKALMKAGNRTEDKKYITKADRIIGVQEGLGGCWITAYQDRDEWKKNNKGRISKSRVRYTAVPLGVTREEAQKHLDEYAAMRGFEGVKE